VRRFAIFCFVCLGGQASWAQHQERRLVDRLLRPNMELQNSAQGKKFAANSAVIEGKGTVGTFVLPPNRREKSFADSRALVAPEYPSHSFDDGSHTSAFIQNRSANPSATIGTSSARDVHDVRDAHKAIASRNFGEERKFREQGKSQKSLDRQDPPMTIEQVRELLNKNK
jgi:hypothetical protein